MALFRATSGSGGGGLTPTRLWNNTATISSSYTFPSQPVTLSDDIDNYEYIKFVFRRSATLSNTTEVMYSISEFKKYSTAASNFNGAIRCYGTNSTTVTYCRGIIYTNDTTVTFGSCAQVGGTETINSSLIPMEIYGLK